MGLGEALALVEKVARTFEKRAQGGRMTGGGR